MADTHVPDRVKELHPLLLPALQASRPDHILHAGDVSTWGVIESLQKIAPVDVVRGNRDFLLPKQIGWAKHLNLAGVSVALLHGHGDWWNYALDKFVYIVQGYQFERYLALLKRDAQDARVIVFGHTHHPVNAWIDGRLLFNPGSASFGSRQRGNPGWGMLNIYADHRVEAIISELRGYKAIKGEWVQDQ